MEIPNRKTFPILGQNLSIPFEVIQPHSKQAFINHGQTLERLAERGGLSWSELVAAMEGRRDATCGQDEVAARKRYKELYDASLAPQPVLSVTDALKSVLAMFPAGLTDVSHFGLRPELVTTLLAARKALEVEQATPIQYVWLNLEKGEFSQSWTEHSIASVNSLRHDPARTGNTLWKLIEYRCLSDLQFQFSHHMKVR